MKLLVLDGNSILNRAFYGIKGLSNKEGLFTNGIYGFLTMFNKIKEETNPDAVAVAFDVKKPTFRHKLFDGYKAKRKGMPEDLAKQLPVLKELLGYLGYSILECEGFEADDILGTLAKECLESGNECIIATGDRDSLQLVSKNVTVRLAATKAGKPEATLFDEKKVFEKYGVEPSKLIDIKAIQGDASDNIPGVPGIGEKGASDLVSRFGSLDYIYENIDSINVKDGIRKKLKAGKDSAYLSRTLGTIRTDVPINRQIEDFVPNEPETEKALNLMVRLEMFSLIEKMGLREDGNRGLGNTPKGKYKVKDKDINLEDLYEKLKREKKVTFLIDLSKENVTYLSVITDGTIFLLNSSNCEFEEFLKRLLEDETIEKQTYDLKSICPYLRSLDINFKNISFDSLLALYLINPSESDYSLKNIRNRYSDSDYDFVEYENSDFLTNVSVLNDSIDALKDEIKENLQEKLLRDIEIPLSMVLSRMEEVGFEVDREGLERYSEKLQSEICELQNQIYDYVGYDFNINSPKQLGTALFEHLGLPAGKKNKSGYSTSADVLESIKYIHPVIESILNYRTFAKLKSTYCDGLIKLIENDGRIHSKFNQVETRTGRISSTEPNLQNIPVRTDVGRELRKFFVAKDGYVLVDADYSQIELRVLAHMASDENMIKAFENDLDIHAITASQVFNIPESMVTESMRVRAKAVNFGIVYGISAFSLSKDINVTVREAKQYIENYFSHYSGVKKYMDECVKDAESSGYATTMFNRRRYLPELVSSNFNLRAFGKRVAMNMPIQGSAADIIKIAMIKVENKLIKENLKSKLILQVHDELIVESPESESRIVAKILKEEMESAANLKVPLVAETSVGKTWYDAKI